MLSYQHEYHAGNFADVLKHCCLLEILDSLSRKEKPFTLMDTHAGCALYSLDDERLIKTGEADGGIKKLLSYIQDSTLTLPHPVSLYVQKEMPFVRKGLYAGSAGLECGCLRQNDTLHLTELHPQAAAKLRENMQALRQENRAVHIHESDSFETLNAITPPAVRRGLIFCDPSYEDRDDFRKTADALIKARRKWNTAVIALWYPLLTRRQNEINQMTAALETDAKTGNRPSSVYRCELEVLDAGTPGTEEAASHMYGSGMLVINPPWQLDSRMEETKRFLYTALHDISGIA